MQNSLTFLIENLAIGDDSMIEFEKIDIENILVIIALSVSLIMAIFYGLDNLAMSIVTGLLGYIGGTIKSSPKGGGDKIGKSN